MLTKLTFFLFILISLAACHGGDFYKTPPPTEYHSADQYAKDYRFSGSILISKNGNDILRKAYGYADKSVNQSNTLDTRFRIGSITKSFTAFGVFQLKKAGLLEYNDKLSRFIADYPRGDEITLRHLLTHQSGIATYEKYIDKAKTYSPLELISQVKDKPLLFSPGSKYNYSNTNYIILGYIIEQLSQSDYGAFFAANIAAPLGLNSTEFGVNHISGQGYAQGYLNEGQSSSDLSVDMSAFHAAGGLSSNLADLERWCQSFIKLELISEEERNEMFQEGYGFGWGSFLHQGRRTYFHGGQLNGFSAYIWLDLETKGLIVILSNTAVFEKVDDMLIKFINEEF